MESAVLSFLDSLIGSEGVKGALIADEHGLCLGVKGIANSNSAGFISAIATYAKSLHDDPNVQVPTIKIETDKSGRHSNFFPFSFPLKYSQRYMYNGTIDLKDQVPFDMLDILCAADELIIDDLIEYIQTYLIQNRPTWIIENLVEILNIVSPRPALSKLTNHCLEEVTLLNPSTFFKSESFLNLSEVALVELLKRDDICMNEYKLWNCVLKWGIANTLSLSYDLDDEMIRENSCNDTYLFKWTSENYQNLEKTLKNCIPLIRFFDISSNEFNKLSPYSKLLPKKLLDDITRYYMTRDVHSTQSYDIPPPRSCGAQIESKIINQKQAVILVNWIDGYGTSYPRTSIPYTFKLLFRASEGNNNPKLFHEKCDNVGPTIIVIKIRGSDRLVGGYNPLNDSWKRSWFSSYRGQKECFVFSIDSAAKTTLDENHVLSKVIPEYRKSAIFDHPWNGPCFGTGPDLWVNTDPNNPIGHATRKSYQHAIMRSRDFHWEDWEVFSIKRNVPE
ncbi:2178_t:CDS:2 [Funneliformis mosseae]|uniref:2178_t:CDS:1 n=1 Tax=Funneliformis mosseae TaxID=27381 RepID=A0A9N8ZWD5_FUNMO|nr:2178_t:CDS:2 [Funneliformis mosseae]